MTNDTISDSEFQRRFKERIMEQSHMTDDEAQAVWESCDPKEWREYGAEPEEAADEEMSCWDGD